MNTEREVDSELVGAVVELMGRSGRHGAVRVRGQSMVPTLIEGLMVGIDFAPQKLVTGDILLFKQKDYLVVHRLVGRGRLADGRSGLKTRGDAVLGLDPRLAPEEIVGRVISVQDEDGWWDVRRPAARFYGRALAWHDRFWAAMGSLAHLGERASRKFGVDAELRRYVHQTDRWLLVRGHRLLFRRMHTRIEAPAVAPDP